MPPKSTTPWFYPVLLGFAITGIISLHVWTVKSIGKHDNELRELQIWRSLIVNDKLDEILRNQERFHQQMEQVQTNFYNIDIRLQKIHAFMSRIESNGVAVSAHRGVNDNGEYYANTN